MGGGFQVNRAAGLDDLATTRADTQARARRPWWIWVLPAVAVFVVLIVQNRFLFDTSLYETGDAAADSILVQRALRFSLLVGHYSRDGFNHPGPAYLYVLAAGQWLGYQVLHLVPTPWNGQFLAAIGLNSAVAGSIVAIVYGWSRRLTAAAAAFAVVIGLIANFPLVAVSSWPPNMFVLTYLLFLVAAASVAARRITDLWLLTLSGWMLIHGYAPFLFFVPLTVAVALVIALWPQRRHPLTAVRGAWRCHRSPVLAALAISAVFIVPIALNLILHWPGQFGRYFSYGSSAKAGGHSVHQVLAFIGWFWWPDSRVWRLSAVALAVALVALLLTLRINRSDHGTRPVYLITLLVMAAVTTAAFLYYAATGADVLSNYYIGYFYWSVPFAVIMAIVVGLARALPDRPVITVGALAGAVAVLAAVAFGVVIRTDSHDSDPAIPAAVAALESQSHGRVSVLEVPLAAWPDVMGQLLQAQRTRTPVCVTATAGAYSVPAAQFVCTPAQLASGVRYSLVADGAISWRPVPVPRR